MSWASFASDSNCWVISPCPYLNYNKPLVDILSSIQLRKRVIEQLLWAPDIQPGSKPQKCTRVTLRQQIGIYIYYTYLFILIYIYLMKRDLRIYLDSYRVTMIYEDASIEIKIFVWKEEKIFPLSKQKLFARMHTYWLRDTDPQHSMQPTREEWKMLLHITFQMWGFEF